MEIEIIIKLFSPFFVLWEKSVCFIGVSLDQRKEGRGVCRKGEAKRDRGFEERERERKSGDRVEGDGVEGENLL